MRSWALALLASCLLARPAAAVNPIQPPAPEFPAMDAWINAKPLTMARLKNRRVVLLAFIDTANLNSLRAVKVLNKWHDTYALSGVMVIGALSPIYGFQRDPQVLRAHARRLGIDFPLIVDSDRRLWNAYANEGWPSFFVIDRKGRIVFSLLGEQRYTELETELRQAAEDLGYKLPNEELVAADPANQDCGAATPERPVAGKASRVDLDDAEAVTNLPNVVGSAREGEIAKRGDWAVDGDSLKLREKNPDLESVVRVVYRGAQAFAVLGVPGRKMSYFLKQDDLWLHAGNAGPDVQFDDDGRSFVVVDEPGLYQLTNNPNDNFHTLAVAPSKPGGAVYAFTFADRCLRYGN